MTRARLTMAGALVALAIAAPSYAQRGGRGRGNGGPPRPPGSGTIYTPATSPATGTAAVTPFAWLDDASILEPGGVWFGLSMARWQGHGVSQTSIPIIDTAVGLTPRLQFAASAPRVADGLGTMFFTAKVIVLSDRIRAMQVAVGPTLEVLSEPTPGGRRVELGLPISAQVDRGGFRIYGSTGYFSPGVWFAGAGVGRSLADRVGVSASFSHAWTSPESSPAVNTGPGARRNELSGGASFDVMRNIALFGSLSRTVRVSAEDGAGTTFGVGLSWSAPGASFSR